MNELQSWTPEEIKAKKKKKFFKKKKSPGSTMHQWL